jgi:acyl carrier protein
MLNTAEKIRLIIVDKLGVNMEDIKDESTFTNDLGADSLDVVELMMEMETEFDIKIPDAEWDGITKVGEVIALVTKKVNEKNNNL